MDQKGGSPALLGQDAHQREKRDANPSSEETDKADYRGSLSVGEQGGSRHASGERSGNPRGEQNAQGQDRGEVITQCRARAPDRRQHDRGDIDAADAETVDQRGRQR